MSLSFSGFRFVGVPVFAAGLLFLTACAKPIPPAGEVSGKVTFKNVPVVEGIVSFTSAGTGSGSEGEVKNGDYKLTSTLPPGEYKVAVMPIVVRQQDGGKGPEVGMDKPAPDIPGKYRVVGTTDLTVTVKEGKNELNFDLKP